MLLDFTRLARRVPKPGSEPRSEPITEQQLSRWKLLSRFIGLLDKHGSRIAPQGREEHGLRDLDRSTYFGVFSFRTISTVLQGNPESASAGK